MGGEKHIANFNDETGSGSPPRGRGKVFVCFLVTRSLRITPAWAGKRDKPALILRVVKDHPRVGGEKQLRGGLAFEQGGSPPRGRGKGDLLNCLIDFPGITPAWAGKSHTDLCGVIRSWDHPRVGGEKKRKKQPCRCKRGSPPRGRGKVVGRFTSSIYDRITPAWAGKSPLSESTSE